MNRDAITAVVVLLVLVSSACTSEPVKQDADEATYQKECIDRSGAPECKLEGKSYEQYKRERDELRKKD